MYLTRMQLDVKKRETMKAFASPNIVHGVVEHAFQGERKRKLWRIDCLNGDWFLLIVSEDQPDLKEAVKQFGMAEGGAWTTKDYEPLLNRIEAGQFWHFRLIANPTISRMPQRDGIGSDRGKIRGKVYAHQTPEQQEQWLISRALQHGFSVEEGDFHAVHQEWYHFKKRGQNHRQISISGVTFEGILSVTDAEIFRKTLCEGLGRGKAYGMGMLTVADCFRRSCDE